jgi:hypothetical protein
MLEPASNLLALLSRSDRRVGIWPSRNLLDVACGFALMNTNEKGGMGRLGGTCIALHQSF